MIISSTSSALRIAMDRHRERLDALRNFSFPIFKQCPDVGGDPVFCGTGFLFRCAEFWFLFSAHHVLATAFPKENPATHAADAHLLVPNGHDDENHLVPITGRIFGITGPMDIAAIQLDAESISRLRWRPLTVADVTLDRSADGWFFVAGCPQQMLHRSENRFNTTMYQFLAGLDPDPEERNDVLRIALRLDRNDHLGLDGKQQAVPAIEGISGSPIWRVFEDDAGSSFAPKVVGIETGYLVKGSVWSVRGTRWGMAREMIRRKFPDLIESAERLLL